uniref:Uncharacterized protein n=1 Tax=Meloidogyne javanica TaxID=6303 RepID=A0A915MPT9_MELJA
MGFEIMGCRKHIEQHYVHGKLLIIEECGTESNWTINEYLQAMDAIPNIAATNARAPLTPYSLWDYVKKFVLFDIFSNKI